MLKTLQNFLNFAKRAASVAIGHKMVRYFPNTYSDYAPGDTPIIDVGKITSAIDGHLQHILKRVRPSHRNVEGGFYVGITGISYAFYHLSKNSILSQNKKLYTEKSIEFLEPALENTAGEKTSFLLGDCGTYALASVVYHANSNAKYKEYLNEFKALFNLYLKPNLLKCGSDEFFVGRAGYLAGILWLRRELKVPVFTNEELYKICDVIVQCGKEYSMKHHCKSPLMYHYYNTEYLGAAHGLAFILLMLLSVPGYLGYNPNAAKDVNDAVNYMLSIQTVEGNWPCTNEEVGNNEHKLIHWCHGAPGTIYLMAKAYLTYKEEKYLESCVKAGDLIWREGLLRKGPGICHGVAGNGYAFLLLHRLTGDNKYLYRANAFAHFMDTDEFNQASVPDCPESLFEGTAGTVCFLADVLVPDTAEFPFQDVFS